MVAQHAMSVPGNDYRMRRDPLHRRHLKKRSPIMGAFFGYLALPFVIGRQTRGDKHYPQKKTEKIFFPTAFPIGFGTYNETDLISHVQFEPRAQFERPFINLRRWTGRED